MSAHRSSHDLLTDLAAALASGAVRVVDLTMPLGPETPVLPLPDPWPNSPTSPGTIATGASPATIS